MADAAEFNDKDVGTLSTITTSKYVLGDSELLASHIEAIRLESISSLYKMKIGTAINTTWKIQVGPYSFTMAHPDSIEDLKIKNGLLTWCDKKDKCLDEVIQSEPTEYFTKKCFQVLRVCFSGFAMFDPSIQMLKKLRATLDDKKMLIESMYGFDGFAFILEATLRQVMLTYGCNKILKSIPRVDFEDLTDKGKATVKASVTMFNRITGQPIDGLITMMKEALMGNDIAEWYYLYFQLLRSTRRDDEKIFYNPPSTVEATALGNAYRLKPESVEILISVCKTLFDYIKYTEFGKQGIATIGDLKFLNRADTVQILCTRMRDLVERNGENVEVLILAASVFVSGRLPSSQKDSAFAKVCLEKAVALNPNNGKCYHRLASWYLSHERNLVEATKNLRKAVELDPFAYHPVIDYFWSLGGNLRTEYILEIDSVLDQRIFLNWPSHALTDIHFIKGCFLLGLGMQDLAAIEFQQAYAGCPEYFGTRCSKMNGSLIRTFWNMKLVNLDRALSCVKKYRDSEVKLSNSELDVLEKMIRSIEEICEKKERLRSEFGRGESECARSCISQNATGSTTSSSSWKRSSECASSCGNWRDRSQSQGNEKQEESWRKPNAGSGDWRIGGNFNKINTSNLPQRTSAERVHVNLENQNEHSQRNGSSKEGDQTSLKRNSGLKPNH